MRSVKLSEYPPTEQYSRTEVACAGFVLRQKDGLCTEVSTVTYLLIFIYDYVTCLVLCYLTNHLHILFLSIEMIICVSILVFFAVLF